MSEFENGRSLVSIQPPDAGLNFKLKDERKAHLDSTQRGSIGLQTTIQLVPESISISFELCELCCDFFNS